VGTTPRARDEGGRLLVPDGAGDGRDGGRQVGDQAGVSLVVRSHCAILASGGADRLRVYSLWLRREAEGCEPEREREWAARPPSLVRLGSAMGR
jgi:hypothetical protein